MSATLASHDQRLDTGPADLLPAKVVLLKNFLPPAEIPFFVELSKRVRELVILLSTPVESNRRWAPEWGDLDVRVQRTTTLAGKWRHRAGFTDQTHVHIPWNTPRLLRQLRPDVLVTSEFGMRTVMCALHRQLHPQSALVLWAALSEHTEIGRGRPREMLRSLLRNRVDHYSVNGPSGERYLEKLGVERRHMSRLHYTILPGVFDVRPVDRTPDQAHHLFFVGQLVERKGVAPFLEALAQWCRRHPDRRVSFDIAGAGPEEPRIRAIALPENLHVEMLGYATYDDLPGWYGRNGILVYPTLADEWGLVVHEGMLTGLPVLGSLYSQAVETLVSEGTNGWVYRPGETGEAYAAIDRALNTPVEQMSAMRTAARGAVEHITPAWAADCLVQSMRQALARRRRDPRWLSEEGPA